MPILAEVIVATFDNPRALDLCLSGLFVQDIGFFSVCVAEDGMDEETAQVVRRWCEAFGAGRIKHVCQPHDGFRKNSILNKAIDRSSADYLIFIDGDCVPSAGFVRRHLALARPGRFLTGGVIRLSATVSEALDSAMVASGDAFSPCWLRRQGVIRGFRNYLKSGMLPRAVAGLIEILTPVSRTWNGGHASGWRKDIVAVNGFDEALTYGGEDIELGFRLNLAGIRGRHLRYSAPLLHLEHSRDYVDPERVASNLRYVDEVRRSGRLWAERGLRSKSS